MPCRTGGAGGGRETDASTTPPKATTPSNRHKRPQRHRRPNDRTTPSATAGNHKRHTRHDHLPLLSYRGIERAITPHRAWKHRGPRARRGGGEGATAHGNGRHPPNTPHPHGEARDGPGRAGGGVTGRPPAGTRRRSPSPEATPPRSRGPTTTAPDEPRRITTPAGAAGAARVRTGPRQAPGTRQRGATPGKRQPPTLRGGRKNRERAGETPPTGSRRETDRRLARREPEEWDTA